METQGSKGYKLCLSTVKSSVPRAWRTVDIQKVFGFE